MVDSVISRNIKISEGSRVKSSVLFPRVTVGKNAVVEYAVVDKNVDIAEGVIVRGTAEHPVVIKKGQKVTEDIIQ